jgi:beta-glucosidase
MKNIFLIFFASLMTTGIHAQNWNEKTNGTISTVTNKGGQTLGYSTTSDIKIISTDGFAFKDLNKNGKIDKYEDWRLPADARAKDLASKMSVEQIAGLMLYSGINRSEIHRVGFCRNIQWKTI